MINIPQTTLATLGNIYHEINHKIYSSSDLTIGSTMTTIKNSDCLLYTTELLYLGKYNGIIRKRTAVPRKK